MPKRPRFRADFVLFGGIDIDFHLREAIPSEEAMLICHCKKVMDSTIREAARNGARSRGLVGRVCGAGTGCGGCLPAVDEIIEDVRASSALSTSPLRILGATG